MRFVGAFFSVSLSLLACVADTSQAQSPFVGTWNCQNTSSVTVTGQATVTEPATADTVAITAGASNQLSVDDVTNNCTISAVASGNSAAITGTIGSCSQTANGVAIDVTYNGGTFVVSGTTLSGNVTAAFTGTANGQPVSGTMAATYSCTQ